MSVEMAIVVVLLLLLLLWLLGGHGTRFVMEVLWWLWDTFRR